MEMGEKNMKKLMKNVLPGVLACSLILFSFTGCGAGGNEASGGGEKSGGAAKGEFAVSGNIWGQGVNALDVIAGEAQYVNESLGNSFKIYNDNFTADTQASNIQNMASSGTQGMMIFGSVPTLYQTLSSTCEKAKIPFVIFDQIPTDEKILDKLEQNAFYAGSVGTDNYSAGANAARKMQENGIESAFILGGAVGDPVHDARVKGFTETFEKGGGKVLAAGRCDSPSDAATKGDDLVSANPSSQGIYALTGDYAIGAITALSNHNKEMAIYCSDTTEECISYIQDGTIVYGDGGSKIVTTLAALLLNNYLNGNAIKGDDGVAPYFNTIVPFEVNADNASLYSEYFLKGHPMNADALKGLVGEGVTYQTFIDFIINYNLEEIASK
ncbi:sugar ABC transporter substrate-binding protein [Anoxybacterium hadale]|uniref:Sugar ABC transporter substrate-binding protein n=1 Tax=Anoxybacterium hadale TaxID=3408580 RepID=A0ACD1ACR2_9FIRM|nr:sugar ABC transporter substrate-binding protein [Clostridiales bacterium]